MFHKKIFVASLTPTLAQKTAILPWAVRIPEKLLRFVLYGNVVGIPDIGVVEVSYR